MRPCCPARLTCIDVHVFIVVWANKWLIDWLIDYRNHYHYQCCCYWCCYLLPEQGSVQSRWTYSSGCLALVASSTDRELQLVVFCTANWRRSTVPAARAQLQPFSKHLHVQRLVSVPRQISEVQLQMVSLCKLCAKISWIKYSYKYDTMPYNKCLQMAQIHYFCITLYTTYYNIM